MEVISLFVLIVTVKKYVFCVTLLLVQQPLTHNHLSPHTYWTRTHLKKHHHLETIYWTLATRYQLNTELSFLSLHRPTAGTGSTSLHSEEGMLQDLVRRTMCWKSFGFLSSDRIKRNEIWVCLLNVQHCFLSSRLFHLRLSAFVNPPRTEQK